MNSTASLVAAPQGKCSISSSTTTHTTLFLLCTKHFKPASALWNHINSVHTSRQEFAAISYFSLHNCLICSSLASHWTCHKHFVQSGCLRPVNGGNSCCCGTLLYFAVALADFQVKTLPLPTNLSLAHLVPAHKSLFMDLGSYDFATLVLCVEPSLEFCNHSKELEHQAFLQSWRR